LAAAALIAPMTYEHAQTRIALHHEYALLSADPDVRGRADRRTSQAQIARFGVTSGGHPADQVADHIGGS
jgi:hypothetical protein